MSEADFPLSRRGFVLASVAGVALSATLAHRQIRSPALQATIRIDDQTATLVNVFTVEPAKLPSLLDLLREGRK
jgi:hypothetical protein